MCHSSGNNSSPILEKLCDLNIEADDLNQIDGKIMINPGIPHLGEQIFESLDTDDLIQCLKVSKAWKSLAEKILLKRWKSKFLTACKDGKAEIVRILMDDFDGDSDELYSGFYSACAWSHKGVVKLLLEHPKCANIDIINAKDNSGETVFALKCAFTDKDMVKFLLYHPRSENIDLGAEDYHGWSALIYARGYGSKDIAKLLLDHPRSDRINFNGKNHLGDSALLFACDSGHWDVVKLLLDHPSSSSKIDINATDSAGRNGYAIALRRGFPEIASLLEAYSNPHYILKIKGLDCTEQCYE